ncbi:MAG: alpha/beta fold hydrolase [Bdellovibrionales bacterium]
MVRIHEGWINGPDWKTVAWNNALTYSPIFSEDITSRLRELNTPTTLIIGTRDRTGPGRYWKKPGVKYELGRYDKLGAKFKNSAPRATVIELPGLGHMPRFEDYGTFADQFFPLF